MERAVHVHLHHPVELGVGERRQYANRLWGLAAHPGHHLRHGALSGLVPSVHDPRVVHEYVDTSLLRDHAIHGGIERSGVGHVEDGDLALDVLGYGPGGRLGQVVHHHVGAVGGEAPGDRGTEARARTGHQSHLAVHCGIVRCVLWASRTKKSAIAS